MSFATLEEMIVAAAEAVRPPERITVSEAAGRYHIVKNPGQHEGPFSLAKTPYLREPMDVLTSLDFTGMAFCGPARTGKSAMAINWMAHTAVTDPADMMVVHMAQHTARDWSQADLAKALRNSPELRRRLVPGRQNDNVFDKRFLSGMRLTVTWPTISNLSGKTIPRLWIMDMDRIKPQIIEKEGHVFDLTRKRADTFKRYGMCAAEASPGFPVTDPKWMAPKGSHEAPPCDGILSIYNRGDRRRWQWECPQCGHHFEPHFRHLWYPTAEEGQPAIPIMDAAEQVVMICPSGNGCIIDPSLQSTLNQGGRWIKEGQVWMPDGRIEGVPRRSDIASFWMFGPAAGFTDWMKLTRRHLEAMEVYDKTGDEGPLMTTVTVDQGDAYVSKQLEGQRLPEVLKDRAEDWGGKDAFDTPYVPAGVRFLVATVDVQAGGRPSFVVHVFGVGANNDIWHVDMFKIRKSVRAAEDGGFELIDPAGYPEDWDLLVSEVMERTYPLNDMSGRRMALKIVACDSGGADGVTANAYDFYRRLRKAGDHGRFHLVKGAPSKSAPRLHKTLPGENSTGERDKFAIARGDVPLWLVNTDKVKDQVSNMLSRDEPGAMIHFPDWAEDWLYTQLTTEIRDDKTGKWSNPSRRKNEAFDLLVYCVAICLHPDVRLEMIDWEKPPLWAADWEKNALILDVSGKPVAVPVARRSLADLAGDLG